MLVVSGVLQLNNEEPVTRALGRVRSLVVSRCDGGAVLSLGDRHWPRHCSGKLGLSLAHA